MARKASGAAAALAGGSGGHETRKNTSGGSAGSPVIREAGHMTEVDAEPNRLNKPSPCQKRSRYLYFGRLFRFCLEGVKTLKALMSIPLDLYKFLEIRCGVKSEEYKLLKSGLIDGDRVVVRCDMEGGKRFASWAATCFSGAGERISFDPDPTG